MVLLPTAPKYSLRQSSFLAVAQSLLKLLTSLQDTRVVLIGSSDPDLTPVRVCPDLAELVVEGNWKDEGVGHRSPSLLSEINSSIPSLHYPSGYGIWKPLASGNTYGGRGALRDTCFIFHRSSLKLWSRCCLNLEELPVRIHPSGDIDEAPSFMILGVGDRFNVLLRVKAIPLAQQQTAQERRVQAEWVFDPAVVANICTEIQHRLKETPETLTAYLQALAGWSAKPNLPNLQSELTVHLLAALDTEVGEQGLDEKSVSSSSKSCPTRSESVKTQNFYPSSQQQQLLQQERLLPELLRVNRSTLGTQVILQRSAKLIQESFEVSRCVIAFYSSQDHRVIWGAIAHAPEIPVSSRQTHYPDWEAVEQSIQQHHQAGLWTTEPSPYNRPVEQTIGSQPAQSVFFTWLPPTPNLPGVSFDTQTASYGLLVVEQWECNQVLSTEQMQLLHLALQQVQQSLEAAHLYQQAEERAQHAALLNQLVDQIRASLELQEIFETVAMQLGHLLVADQCSILQYLEEHKVWQPVTEYRAHPDVPTSINLIIPDQNNPVISQLHNLHIVEVSDTRNLQDPLNKSLSAKYPGGWLMVPIHRQGRIWGCLNFAQDKYPRYWHQSELRFLITVADQLAIAIYQATLYQQIQQQNQTLEALVRARTAELESFFDAHPDYIFVVEREEERLRFCNNAFAQGMGFENRQQVQGRSIQECFSHDVANFFAQQNCVVFDSGQTLHEQESLLLADGIHHFDTFRVPLKYPSGEVYACLGTSRDITELVQTKQALCERTEQLQDALSAASAASQAKSDFLAGMSHELRTPLTAVIGMSSALLKQYLGQLNPKQAEYVRIIHESGKHLLQLINDILDLSKIEAGKASLTVSQFSLAEVASSCLELLRDKAQAQQVKLVGELSGLPKSDNFYGDERRVRQILLNLLSNAVKFTPSGGEVRLCMHYDGHTAMIEVADTGIGIPPEKQHLLFEAFQQIDSSLNRKHEGTGLGLALTRQLVEMHGGTIGFDSTVGVGTVFTVYLQAQPPTGEPEEEGAASQSNALDSKQEAKSRLAKRG